MKYLKTALLPFLLFGSSFVMADSTIAPSDNITPNDNYQSKGGQDWELFWTGDTTGSILVPSKYNEVMVETSKGTYTATRMASAQLLATDYNRVDCSGSGSASATAKAYFSGGYVRGDDYSSSTRCHGQTYRVTARAKVSIYKILGR